MGLKYFYVVVPEEDVMVYIWDAGVPGEEGVCDLGDTDAYYGGGDELMHAAFSPDAEQTILITNNEEYGYLASAYVAILDSSGEPAALASIDISMDMIDRQISQFVLLMFLVICTVLLASVFAYYFYIRRALIRPLGTLHQAALGLVEHSMEPPGRLPRGHPHRRRGRGSGAGLPVYDGPAERLHPEPGAGDGGEGAHRGGAGRGGEDSGGYAALHLPGLPRPE